MVLKGAENVLAIMDKVVDSHRRRGRVSAAGETDLYPIGS